MGISLIDSYICIINLFNMYQKFTNILQDIKDFLPGGPNKKYIASFLFLFIWMALFDKNRWVTQWQLQRSIYKYEREKRQVVKWHHTHQTNDKGCQQRYRKIWPWRIFNDQKWWRFVYHCSRITVSEDHFKLLYPPLCWDYCLIVI